MESPFFGSYVQPSRTYHISRTPRDIPVQAKSSSPEVVSIPIHFVGSEKSRSTAARRIQKVYRGFLVRNSMKKVVSIKREVDEIERKILLKETADLIRKDAKERLKMNEMLMALLFRLDSVRGVDSGVRDCRKAAIKKAIMLQEKLDAIASGYETLGESEDQHAEGLVDSVVESEAQQVEGFVDSVVESEDQQVEGLVDSVVEAVDQIEGQLLDSEFNSGQEDSKSAEKFEEKVENEEEALNTESVDTEGLKESPGENQSSVEEEADAMQIDQADPIQGRRGTEAARDVEDKVERQDENKVLMERMIEKNDILLGMVADLCEKNKMQTQMINSLSKRVDHLEKAFKSERSKRKKRRQAAGFIDVLRSPEQ